MTKVKDLTLHTKKAGPLLLLGARLLLFWGMLLGALYLSKVLLGGHWVVDIMAAVAAILGLLVTAPSVSGESIQTTRAELWEWLNAGAPEDFKAWRRTRQNIAYYNDRETPPDGHAN